MRRPTPARKIAISAAVAACVFAVTALIHIPIPMTTGYVNLGDAVIYFAAFVLGGAVAAPAAFIGSAMADLVLGAPVYMPAAIVKALAAVVCIAITRRGEYKIALYALGCVAGGLIMAAGYGAYELALFSAEYAVVGVPFNLAQAGVNAAACVALYPAAKKLRENYAR